MTKLYDAFISYGRPDSLLLAKDLKASLEAKGFAVWFDKHDIKPGVDYQKKIDDGIEKASNFLFIISPHSVNSPYCGKELDLAIKLNKRIITLMHVKEISRETWQGRNQGKTSDKDWEDAQAKGLNVSNNLDPRIRKIHRVSFQEGKDDFEKSLAVLIEALGEDDDDYVKKHRNLLVKALEWELNHKQTIYLLIGEEIEQAKEWLKKKRPKAERFIPTDLLRVYYRKYQECQ